MKCIQAKKLRNGDPVIRKSDGRVLHVITVRVPDEKAAIILCNDGKEYPHADLR